MAREQLKTLTEPMYYILLSLIKENHGYGIMQMISELTEGRVSVGAGTMYNLLGRFEKEEIIVPVAEENRRKIYRLSDKGRQILQEEFQRLNKMVSDGQKFMEYDGERPEPPEDDSRGSGISIPIEERIREYQQSMQDSQNGHSAGEGQNTSNEETDKKHLSNGGLGKGVLIPT
ncbi:PadR family transcriptional regulator [Aminipila terrae]|uniref:Transcription regulator PadR N-terminal domain-containing protein n=1 Tax=Aminipila terrae TaxID=2697030 RepID=A0A6P1MM97_9FIRM|nr:hypothetical protein Ami3637_06660 [Aminipila terrae]